MKCVSIFSAASKSAMTPSFIGLMAVMLPGVRPSISLASVPTASIRPLILLSATMEGSLTTMPLPRAKTQVLAVPRSMARSWEKRESSDENMPRRTATWMPSLTVWNAPETIVNGHIGADESAAVLHFRVRMTILN